jgi:hypothetical protein
MLPAGTFAPGRNTPNPVRRREAIAGGATFPFDIIGKTGNFYRPADRLSPKPSTFAKLLPADFDNLAKTRQAGWSAMRKQLVTKRSRSSSRLFATSTILP